MLKGKKKIKLLKSQKLLLQARSEKIQEALNLAQIRQNEFQGTLNMILIEEHGISPEELDQWRLSDDGQAIEWIKPPEKPDKEEK